MSYEYQQRQLLIIGYIWAGLAAVFAAFCVYLVLYT